MQLLSIFINIILPVFIQVGLGYLLQKKFEIDVKSLVKILIYVVLPSVLFVNVYHSGVENHLSLSIVVYAVYHFALMFAAGRIVSKLSGLDKGSAGVFTNTVMFYNSANFCLPLIELIFEDPYAVSLLAIVIMVSSSITYSVGVFNASLGNSDIRKALLNIFRLPMLYSIAAAFTMRQLGIGLWPPMDSALQFLARGIVPVSLITLGAQLAITRFSLNNPRVYLANFMRLVISPVIALLLVKLIGLEGVPAQVLVISSAAPTAVNTIILAIEYKSEPDFASRAVLSSTVLSAFTVSGVIYMATTLL